MKQTADTGHESGLVADSANLLSLRLLEEQDGAIIFHWINDPALRRLTGTRGDVTREDHQKWLSGKLADQKNRTYIIEMDGRPAGLIGINNCDAVNRNAEMYLYIGDASNRGQGVGTAAIRLFSRKMFDEAGLHKLTARIFSYNPASIRAFERAGFLPEGVQKEQIARDGMYYDLHLYGLIDHSDVPAEGTI